MGREPAPFSHRVSDQEMAGLEAILAAVPLCRCAEPPRKTLSADQVALLEEGGFDLDGHDLGVEDPVARAACDYALLRATGLTTSMAAERLGLSESRVRQRLLERTLYGIKIADEWRLPLFQFTPRGLVLGLEHVLPALPEGLHPVSVYRWLATPSPELARSDGRALTPLEWLRSGHDPEAVAELARDL